MGKYEPLSAFLKSQNRDHIPMTFSEIERVLGSKLPPSKLHRAWWSNNPNNNVMTKEWLSAGYVTEAVDVEAERLVFRKATGALRPEKETRAETAAGNKPLPIEEHPGFGFMRGQIRIEPGFDVTRPFEDEWEEGWLGVDENGQGSKPAA